MNINPFLSLAIQKKKLVVVCMVTMVLVLPYLRIIAFLKFLPRSLGLSSSFTQGPFLSNSGFG